MRRPTAGHKYKPTRLLSLHLVSVRLYPQLFQTTSPSNDTIQMPAISTSASSLAAAATVSALPARAHKATSLALVLKIVIPLGVVAVLAMIGVIVYICRTPDYDEDAPVNLRSEWTCCWPDFGDWGGTLTPFSQSPAEKRLDEDPAPAYDAEKGPPTYTAPVTVEARDVRREDSEEQKKAGGDEEASGRVTLREGGDRSRV